VRIIVHGVRAECEDALDRIRSVFDVVGIEDPLYLPPGSLLVQMHIHVRFGPVLDRRVKLCRCDRDPSSHVPWPGCPEWMTSREVQA
jgi:hypothetical protein